MVPLAIDAVVGVSVMDSATTAVTNTVVVVVNPPAVAVIVTGLPLLLETPVTIPVTGSTDAIVESEEDHAASASDWVVLSL